MSVLPVVRRSPSTSSSRLSRSSTMERRNSILGSLMKKFSKKNENAPNSSFLTPNPANSKLVHNAARSRTPSTERNSNNPFSSSAPPTRRPDRPGMNAFTTPTNEPPPAYSPPAPGAVVSGSPTTTSANGPRAAVIPADDRYAFLCSFDTVFLIDDSGSMAGRSWRETRQALEAIAPICTAHDADGIDIFFLNNPDQPFYRNVTSSSTVVEIFTSVRPMGGTPTGQRLNRLLRDYLRRYIASPDATKPLNIIVITDGEPSDDVESPIINAAKKLDKLDAPAWQIGIQFFQVGNEPGAKDHLKQLDDELAELAGDDDLRDMVDTVPFSGKQGTELTGEGILKVVLGAVNRRLDRKRSKELHRNPTEDPTEGSAEGSTS